MKTVKLGEIADLTVGFVGSMTEQYIKSGVPFLRSLNIKPFEISSDDIRYISKDFNIRISKSILHEGDVVIVRTGLPGTCSVVPKEYDGCNCSDVVIVHPDNDLVDSNYLAGFINFWGQKQVNNNKVGAIQKHFNVHTAEEMLITLPEIEVQRKIAKLLNGINGKIKNNQKINDNLLSQILTIYDYWFTQYRFPDAINTKFVNNDILQKSIPNDWDVNTLGSMFTLLRDGTHNPPPRVASGIPLLTGIMFGDNFLNHSVETYITQDDYSAIHSKYEPLAGDLLLTKIGTVGKVNLLMEEDLPIAIHCNSALLRPYDSDVMPFLFAMLKSKTLQAKLKHEVSKTVQEFISLDKLASIIVEVPSRDLQISFSKTITPMIDMLRTKHQESLELLKLRQWLLPMLMNGQTSIND